MPAFSRFFVTRLSIIDRYLLREFAYNMAGVISVLWLIFIATRFARYLAEAAIGNLPTEVIFSLLGYSSLGALSILLPIGTFLAVMLGLSRLNVDSELVVIAACGVSASRITRNVLLFSTVMAVVVAVLSLLIVPNVLSGSDQIEQKAKMAANTSGLVAGSFKESRQGDWTFYSQGVSKDKQDMENIFIEINRSSKKRPLTFRAEKGHFEVDEQTGDKYLVLEKGYRYEGEAGEQDFAITQFATHNLLVEKGNQGQVRERDKHRPTAELWQSGSSRDIAEIEWRVATPIMTVVLSLIAISLAQTRPRQGRYAGFFPAVLIYILYSNLLAVNQAWVAKELITPWLGAIWVHLFMLGGWIVITKRHLLRRSWCRYRQKTVLR